MTPKSWKPLHFRLVLLSGVVAALFFAAACVWRDPLVGRAETITDDPTAAPTQAAVLQPSATVAPTAIPSPTPTLEPTPIPIEWRENKDQTTGVVFGGVVLVLIIVGGTVSVIVRRNRSPEG